MQNNPDTAAGLEQQVHALMRSGKLREAMQSCDSLNRQFPEYLSGWVTASQLALQSGEANLAMAAIDRALLLSPERPELLLQKLVCHGAAGETEAARQLGERVVELEFSEPYAASNAGLAMMRAGMHDLASQLFDHAAKLDPETGTHHYNLATTQRFLGDFDNAEINLDRAIELSPKDSDAWHLRSSLRTQTVDENHIEGLRAALEQAEEDYDRVRLGFAIAKECEDLALFDESFEALSAAAALRRQGLQYTPERELETMRKIREVFTRECLEEGGGHVNASPIFVIGMPRTGTTLVDRILSSHSVVTSAGELHNFAVQMQKLCMETFGSLPATPAELVELAVGIDFEALGEAYVQTTRGVAGQTAHFVDKLPFNFLYAGAIHLALPKAKIVLLQRDPMDTCYAVYKTLFEAAYPYSYDLTELANYFVEYHHLAKHWLDSMGSDIHVVRYEGLVSDSRPVIEDLLDHCGLSYEDTCFRFHENPNPTTTASATQVRRSMHTRSVGNWRNFEQQLQPVSDILASAGIVATDSKV